MIGRIAIQCCEVFGVIHGPELRPPFAGSIKKLIANHVQERRDAEYSAKQRRSLRHSSCDEQAGV
jgi:hypothetical protein